jgi:predicted dehydrogenase
MGTPTYRAAVIGCGQIGSRFSESDPTSVTPLSHAHAYHRHPSTDLVGLYDADPARLRAAGNCWGAPTFDSVEDLLRQSRPDIVSLCTPDATHYPLAREILERAAPKILFIEKPLAESAAQGERLRELARTKGCRIAVNFSRRYSMAFRQIATELHAGTHGRPLLGHLYYSKGLTHNGSHGIDLIRMWLGEPLFAQGRPSAWAYDGDATYFAEFEMPQGCIVRFDAFDESIATVFEFDLMTERARIQFSRGGLQWSFSDVAPNPLYPTHRNFRPVPRADAAFAAPMLDCLTNAVQNLVDHLGRGADLLCEIDQAIPTLRWVDELKRAPHR